MGNEICESVALTSIHFINISRAPTVCQVLPGLTPGNRTKHLPSAKPTGDNSYRVLDPGAMPSKW